MITLTICSMLSLYFHKIAHSLNAMAVFLIIKYMLIVKAPKRPTHTDFSGSQSEFFKFVKCKSNSATLKM